MHQTPAPIRLATTAPVAETNPAVAAAGAVGTASDSGHLHAIAAPATPSTQAFGDAAASGAGVGMATDTHKHAMPTTWTKIVAGTLGAVSVLDLAGLSGYQRYHLVMVGKGLNAAINPNVQLDGNVGGNYNSQRNTTKNTANAAGGDNGGTSIGLSGSIGAAGANMELSLLVTHDDAAASPATALWQIMCMSGTITTDGFAAGGGFCSVGDASLTEIKVTLNATLTTGHYVLYGSKETS